MQTLADMFLLVYETIQPWLPLLASVSILMALASMILIPLLIVKMPADYFVEDRHVRHWNVWRALFYIVRNAFAVVLLVAGIIMLVLPGQGLLTIIIAVMVSDVPGKYRFERFLLRQRGVLKSMNWVRKRYNKPPLQKPQSANAKKNGQP